MPEFDPYLKWLGIREVAHPINHYRLLGLEILESDPEVISRAADRQMSHIRTYQNGPHGDLSQKILSELAIARRCLLDPPSKQFYDQQFEVAAPPIAANSPQAIPQPRSAPSPPIPAINISTDIRVEADANVRTNRKKREQSNLMQGLIGWTVGAIAALGIGGWIVNSGVIPGVGLSKTIETTEIDQASIVPSESLETQTPSTLPNPIDQTSRTTLLDQPLNSSPADQKATIGSGSNQSPDHASRAPSANPDANALINTEIKSQTNSQNSSDTEFGQSAFGTSFNKQPFPEMPVSPQPGELATGPQPSELRLPSSTDTLEHPPSQADPSETEETALPLGKPPGKSSPPSKKEIKTKQDELGSLYSSQIASAKNNDQMIHLGKLLLVDSRTAQPYSPMHYVMLEQTIEIASRSGDALTAFTAIQELNQYFEIDYWDRATNMMESTAPNAPRKKVNEFKTILDKLIVESIEARKFEHGNQLAGLAISLAKRANDDQLSNFYQLQKQRIIEHVRLIKSNQKAETTLLTEPDHPASNLTHGEYLFVVENDIENALTYWANSQDEELTKLAALESQLATDSPNPVKPLTELAAAWEKMGQNKESFFERKGLERAIELNQLALPYVNGLDRRWVESNITRLETLLSE